MEEPSDGFGQGDTFHRLYGSKDEKEVKLRKLREEQEEKRSQLCPFNPNRITKDKDLKFSHLSNQRSVDNLARLTQ
jgi:hypothetical protein